MRVNFIQCTIHITHPLRIRILYHLSCAFIGTLLEIVSHETLGQINKIKQTLQSLMQEVQSLRAQVGSAAEENQKLMESAAQTDMNVPDSMEIQSDNPMFAQA